MNVPADVAHFDTPFLTDIAHNADPSPPPPQPGRPTTILTPDTDTAVDRPAQPAGPDTYDDELLDTHFCAGDGRVNENIALTTIHQVFHSEHDRLVGDIKNTLTNDPGSAADVRTTFGSSGVVDHTGWNGDRLFQAARFVTEMEYQHLVFEEFARKVQPAIRPFHIYHSDLNPAIPAEFAHAVYRFGHSMLDDDVARMTDDANGVKTDNSLPLLTAFLNPPEYFNSGDPPSRSRRSRPPARSSWAPSDQDGNELDEFVTETLRNNLLGLPLDLPTHQHDPRSRGGRAVAQRPAPSDPRPDQRRPAGAVHRLVGLRPAPEAPRVAGQLRRRVRRSIRRSVTPVRTGTSRRPVTTS